MPKIPERNAISDTFHGVLLRVNQAHLLASSELPGTETIVSGSLIVRYGIQYLGKPHLAIVPGLVALDYGDMITGENAWKFLLRKSNLHPRADVLGYRNDGQDDMVVVKWLDLAAPIRVLVFTRPEEHSPVATVDALITSKVADVPQRLMQYLPHFESLGHWMESRS